MSLPDIAEPLPSSFQFGKVVGRVIHAIADTAEDADDKPQARAAAGTVKFTPVDTLRKTTELDYPALVTMEPVTANLSASGRILDAEGRQGVWLVTGVWNVSFQPSGTQKWTVPGFQIEVTTDYDDETPMDLAVVAPYVPPATVAVTTLLVPSTGTEGQLLARDENGDLVWVDPSAGGGYEPPVEGIPLEDLEASVQTKLAAAESAVQPDDLAPAFYGPFTTEAEAIAGTPDGGLAAYVPAP